MDDVSVLRSCNGASVKNRLAQKPPVNDERQLRRSNTSQLSRRIFASTTPGINVKAHVLSDNFRAAICQIGKACIYIWLRRQVSAGKFICLENKYSRKLQRSPKTLGCAFFSTRKLALISRA